MVEGALQIPPRDRSEYDGVPLWFQKHDLFLVDFLQDTFDFYIANEVSGPAFLMVSVWNAGGLQRYTNPRYGEEMLGPGDRFRGTQLDCDTVYLQNFDRPASEVMQQPLNIIWNGLGSQRCPSYDLNNRWQPIGR